MGVRHSRLLLKMKTHLTYREIESIDRGVLREKETAGRAKTNFACSVRTSSCSTWIGEITNYTALVTDRGVPVDEISLRSIDRAVELCAKWCIIHALAKLRWPSGEELDTGGDEDGDWQRVVSM